MIFPTNKKCKTTGNSGNSGNPATGLSEIQLQAACFQWAWNNYPRTRMCLFHVPNGSKQPVFKLSGPPFFHVYPQHCTVVAERTL